MRKKAVLVISLAAVLLFGGCVFKSGESLYKLPKAPEEYYELQIAIDAVLEQGLEYCAPVSGNNLQAVQLVDLNGDGIEEAVAFFKAPGEKPLRVYIFKNNESKYENVHVIAGDGTAFDSIDYLQLDNSPELELVIGWQVSDQVLQTLTAYTIKDCGFKEIMTASYSEYKSLDIDNDGSQELLLIKFDPVEKKGLCQLYNYVDGAFVMDGEAPLSQGMEEIRRIKTGDLEKGTPALFVSGKLEGSAVVTDIFAIRKGEFVNIVMSEDSKVSTETIRNHAIYTNDIDKDGILELPRTEKIPSIYAEDSHDYYLIHWYSVLLSGKIVDKAASYHNYTDGWYFLIPEDWLGRLCVGRRDTVEGERALEFALLDKDGKAGKTLLVIYTLTGDNRFDRSKLDGRFDLYIQSGTVFSAEIPGGSKGVEGRLSAEEVRNNFSIIRSEWISGKVG